MARLESVKSSSRSSHPLLPTRIPVTCSLVTPAIVKSGYRNKVWRLSTKNGSEQVISFMMVTKMTLQRTDEFSIMCFQVSDGNSF